MVAREEFYGCRIHYFGSTAPNGQNLARIFHQMQLALELFYALARIAQTAEFTRSGALANPA
jgi:hypothetical protein